MNGRRSLLAAINAIARPNLDEVGLVYELLRHHRGGVMVDVGAHFGSALRSFAADGWKVYALEPDPANRAELERQVAHLPNVIVDGRAVAERDGVVMDLYTSGISSGISTLAPFHPSHTASVPVRTIRLDTLLAEVDCVTVLKTDTEGYDLRVLRTFPWDRLHPAAVVSEFEDRKTTQLGYDFRDMAEYLTDRGYEVFISEWYPVVEYGQRHRWRSLRRFPARLQDPHAWGNLIAIQPGVRGELPHMAAWHRRFRSQASRAIRKVRR